MHNHALLIIPANIYEHGPEAIMNYIFEQLKPYYLNLIVDPYIEIIKVDLQKEYEKYKLDYNIELTMEDYCQNRCYELDVYGNAISTYNRKGFYDYYVISRWTDKPDGPQFNFEEKLCNELEAEIIINKTNPINIHKILAKYYTLSSDIINIRNSSTKISDLLEAYMIDKDMYEILLHDITEDNYQTFLENHINNYVIYIDYHS